MNTRFVKYLEGLKPSQKLIARNAVAEYIKGDSDEVEIIRSAVDIYKKMRHLSMLTEEHAYALFTHANGSYIKSVCVGRGDQVNTIVDIRGVIREALLCNAISVVLVHNHPSGSLKPSRHDDKITESLRSACDVMGLHLIDHVIVANGNYYSYQVSGYL